MLDKYVFDEELNEIVCLVENDLTGEEETVTGPGVNEVFMIKVILEKNDINSLLELDDRLKNTKGSTC